MAQVPCAILDVMATISSKTDKYARQIWLGNSALATVMLTIDPRELKITARVPASPLPRGATVVPFTMKDGRIWVDLKIGKKSIQALVDTGTVGTLLPMSVAKDMKITSTATFEMTHPNGKDGK